MCGFFSIISRAEISETRFQNSLNSIKHRGPDQTNIKKYDVNNAKIFFGHQRLKILDISLGNQPMETEDKKYSIIFNGEIYNHQQVRNELIELGIKFKTVNSDTETILLGYSTWGENILKKLNGMFSFIILDKIQNIIFGARDRVGEKPLFYYLDSSKILFASEILPIKIYVNHLEISTENVAKYNALGFIPKNLTAYKKVFQIDAGEYFIYKIHKNDLTKKKYWSYNIQSNYSLKAYEAEDKLRYLIESSVKQRLVSSDTEVGIFLSGGLDSSIITKYATKYSENIKSFSINFKQSEISEKKYFNHIGNLFKTKQIEFFFDQENSNNLLNEISKKNYDLYSDSSILSYFYLTKKASEHVKVVLGGDGADELFGGYETFNVIKIISMLKKLKLIKTLDFFKIINHILPERHINMSMKFKLSRLLKYNSENFSISNARWISPLNLKEINTIHSQNFSYDNLYEEVINEWNASKTTNNIDKTLEFYFNFFLKNQMLVKIDRLAMLNGLEVRSPFLDYEIIDFVSTLPYNFKVSFFKNKIILKNLFSNTFDKNFLYRKKVGLTSPLSFLMSNNLLDLSLKSKYLSNIKDFYSKLLNDHKNYVSDNRLQIWNIKLLDFFYLNNE
jgi:asparagine synthase (glutamine-hydrolysing)